jgi:Uma2 family endonuclease
MTAEEYLAMDSAADFRSEFLDGDIVAMSGGSPNHSGVKINLAIEVGTALRGTPCRAFDSDLRVRVSSSMYTYPDLTVVRGKLIVADPRRDVLLNPAVIFEVLSPSTEYYDRGLKLRRYREIATLNRLYPGRPRSSRHRAVHARRRQHLDPPRLSTLRGRPADRVTRSFSAAGRHL